MTTTTTTTLRLGLIGCGRIAQVAHLPAIAKSERVRLVGVSDPSERLSEGVAARYGVAAFRDTDELLAQDLDAVLVAVPDRHHLPLGRAALAAGKHVLMEKPSAATAAQGRELAELADSSGRLLQIGAMRRHDSGLRYAKEAIIGLGDILTASFSYRLPTALRASTEAALFPATVVDDDVRSAETAFKADRPTYLLRTHGAHVFDTARFLLGDVSEVRCQLARSSADLHWQGTLMTERGLASFAITANTHSDYSERVDVWGERGQVGVDSYFPFYRRSSSASAFDEVTGEWRSPEFGAVDPYQQQLDAFVTAILDDGDVEPNGWDGLAALELIEACAASVAADGTAVKP